MEGFEGEKKNLKVNTVLDREPAQLFRRSGVTCSVVGVLMIIRAAEFWTNWSLWMDL